MMGYERWVAAMRYTKLRWERYINANALSYSDKGFVRNMYNNDDYKKKLISMGAGFYTARNPPADSNILCENLVAKLTDRSDGPSQPQPTQDVPPRPDVENSSSDQLSDSDNLEIADEESDWSSGPPTPLKVPRAFKKSDDLYERQAEAEKDKEVEDWSTDTEDAQPEGQPKPQPENPPQP